MTVTFLNFACENGDDGYSAEASDDVEYDEYGNVCMVVDAELKNRVQIALLDMLMNFEIVVM